jgi:beta-lactam-binding protein with PASTA domain
VPLIDGTYEILEQRPTEDGRTLVRATDPDGLPVRIVWYEVTAEAEGSFERYRRTLRRLSREPDVLLRDVVSRPGARYAVWDDPAGAPTAEPDGAWRARLDRAGLDPDRADLRRRGRDVVLAGLDWSDDPDALEPGPADAASVAAPTAARRERRPWSPTARAWLATALLAASAAAFALAGWSRYVNDAAATVPETVGSSADDAAARLARAGFAAELRAVAGDGPAFTVVASDPEPGAALRPGRTVRIDYLRPDDGAAAREAPALVGRTLAEAAVRLEDVGLALGRIARVPAAVPEGTVLGQRPAAGTELPEGRPLDLLVSDGPRPERSFLPDLTGLPLAEARELARLAGLPADRILVDAVVADGVPPGRVVAMTPAPWHLVRVEGTTVRLMVSDPRGAGDADDARVGAPDLVGLPLAEARARALEAGVAVTTRRVSQSALPDGVVLQEPPPGALLDDGLRLVVNARPRPLPTPTPEVRIQAPRLRWIPYRFLIEPGIPEQRAELRATTAEGDERVVLRRSVRGGDVLEGVWPTRTPGPVTFELRLNDVPYADSRVMREVDGP